MNKLLKNSILFLISISFSSGVFAATGEKVEISLEGRVRAEAKGNSDFNDSTGSSTDQTLSRFRMNLTANVNENTSMFFQPQYSKTWGSPTGTSGALTDDGGTPNTSVHQAYINYSPAKDWSILVGRAELNYGDQLLIGAVGWHNVGRSFDATRVRYDYGMGKVDFLWSEINEESAGATSDTTLLGLYSMNDFGQYFSNVDFYLLTKSDNTGGHKLANQYYGVRLKSNIADFDYRAEVTLEKVEVYTTAKSSESANQYDIEVGHKFGPVRVDAEYFLASEYYDQLAPTGHKWLGYADLFSRKNITGFRVGVEGKITENFSAKIHYHDFSRTKTSSAAYTFTGAAWSSTASNKKSIANEIDLVLSYKVDKNVSVLAGYSTFSPGDYLKEVIGRNDSGNYGFVQLLVQQ